MFKKEVFGLDISDNSIEALLLSKAFFGQTKVMAYARIKLKAGIIDNGLIKKPKELEKAIVDLLASAQPKAITSAFCVLSLPESQVFSTVFKLPAGLKDKEIKNTIPYKAEEEIPFKSSEIYFDFKKIYSYDSTQEVFYVAVPTKIVDSYLKVLGNIGLRPIAFDLESISLARALVDPLKKAQAKLLIDIGAQTTKLNIFDRNGIRQSLVLDVAGDQFTKAIAAKFKVTGKQADEIKFKCGFSPKKEKGRVFLVLQNEFRQIIAEARKFIEYYHDQNQRQIDEVILAGGSSLLPKVDQYIADNLAIKTEVGNPLAKINDKSNLLPVKNNAILFADVVGLTLRGINRQLNAAEINLLPVQSRRITLIPIKGGRRNWFGFFVRLAVLIFLTLAAAGLFIFWQKGAEPFVKFFPVRVSEVAEKEAEADLHLPAVSEEGPTAPEETEIPPEETAESGATSTPTSTEPIIEEPAEEPAEPAKAVKVKVRQTSLGYLNVRKGPGTSYEKIAEILPGGVYVLLKESNGWFELQLAENKTGWVYSIYVDKLE